MRVAGVVLCGGRSSRMGRPKAWLPVGGEPLLVRVVRVVGGVVSPVVVVAAPGQELPPLPAGVELVRDEREGLGPLAGLAAGLAALDGRADAAFLAACDLPDLTPSFVRRVLDAVGDADACVPVAAGVRHPLAAVYRVSLLPLARELLAGGAGPLRLLDAARTRELVVADSGRLRNVNTPADYAALAPQDAP